MKAIPEAARQEVISSRDMSSVNILFLLLILFQPGGLKERSMLLSFLSNPGAADGPAEGVAILRKWHRCINRAQSMGATLPDCSILMTGLDHLAASMLQGYPTTAFRLNLIRTEHRLDHVPQLPTVMIYAWSLQAELEQAAISPLPETMSPKKQWLARIDHGQSTKGVEPKGGDPKGTCPKGGDKGGKGGKPESSMLRRILRLKPRVKPRITMARQVHKEEYLRAPRLRPVGSHFVRSTCQIPVASMDVHVSTVMTKRKQQHKPQEKV